MSLIEKIAAALEREIDNVPMVLTDPLRLRRLRAERLAQAALTAIMGEGDGVQEVDRIAWRAAREAFDAALQQGGSSNYEQRSIMAEDQAAAVLARHRIPTALRGGDGVQQCDRDAAQAIYNGESIFAQAGVKARDGHELVQAFARHRSTAAAAERARIVAWLRKQETHNNKGPLGIPHWAYAGIAARIEAGEV